MDTAADCFFGHSAVLIYQIARRKEEMRCDYHLDHDSDQRTEDLVDG